MSEYIVFTNREHYNDLGIVRSLGESGIRSILVAVKGPLKFVGYSRYVKKAYYVDDVEEGYRLIRDRYSRNNGKAYILSGNDIITAYLDSKYEELKDHFYFYNAGEAGRINYYMNKDNMFDLVRKYGLNVARTWKVSVGEIPDDIEYPVMTKAINSLGKEWKSIVYVCSNKEELLEVYSKISSTSILLQRYISKTDEVSFQGISVDHGRQVCIVTNMRQKYNIPETYSPLWIVENNKNQEMAEIISKIMEDFGFEGIFEFEFLEDKDGNLWFLEINLRSAADGYATTVAGMSQVTLWCKAIENNKIPEDYYKDIPEGFLAIAECFDYDVRVKKGRISHGKWLREYFAMNCKLYKGRRDFVPFFLFMWYKLTKMKH